ncbi:unnamed protein product [Lepidochelys kempii]
MATQALAWVLLLGGSQPAVALMDQERGWQLLEEAQPEGFALLSRPMLPRQPLLMENEPKVMRKQVVRAVLQRTEDSNIHIRGRALHGLRNAVTEFPGKQILGSFVCTVCECCDPRAVLDAMEGLCWMLRDPKAPRKAHVAVSLALQARTFFEDENSGLRRASMELFGHLSKLVSKKSSLFRFEVQKSLGTLLIHLQDGDPQACRVALLCCAPFLSCQPLRTLVRSQLAEGAAPAIPAFLSEACRTLRLLERDLSQTGSLLVREVPSGLGIAAEAIPDQADNLQSNPRPHFFELDFILVLVV